MDMTARYWATGIPTNPHPSEWRNVRRLMVGAPREGAGGVVGGGEGDTDEGEVLDTTEGITDQD